jgi:DNA topoisomerase I
MAKDTTLIIVESPTKARTLGRFLGSDYKIEASNGHVRDLPKSKLGIEVEHNFEPIYDVPKDKKEIVARLRKEAKSAGEVYLATDPDREGEAIAWHISHLLGKRDPKRISFHEITELAVQDALKHPHPLNLNLVDAQQARRVLDRLVGYKLSPLLWRKVRIGLSAGRVQSVALRLIVDREREIERFVPEEYWSLLAKVKRGKDEFLAAVIKKDNEKLEIKSQSEADRVENDLSSAELKVVDVKDSEARRSPYPPFTTSSFQQAAANRLGFTSKKTMMLAQQLYEGIELGSEGPVGLITYMRTDSVNLAAPAVDAVRGFIGEKYGNQYVPASARVYKAKSKNAQEAHEAIRPTLASRTPESVKNHLNKDQHRLYELIWQRFVACQMADANYAKRRIDIAVGEYLMRASGSKLKFAGFLKVYEVVSEEESMSDDEDGRLNEILPNLVIGDMVELLDLLKEQHFTEPPARYSEATLIKALEEYGIGRPSTYAPTISTIIDRRYVEREQRRLSPTSLGVAVTDFLVANFSNIVDLNFTAKMEDDLDEVADGKVKWQPLVSEFYGPFEKHLEDVTETAARVKIEAEETGEVCPECSKPVVIRIGRFGKFLACSGYPDCKYTAKYMEKVEAKCPDDGGDVVLLRTKRGRPFYGCSNYPSCKFMSWTKPGAAGENGSEMAKPKRTAKKSFGRVKKAAVRKKAVPNKK